MVPFIDGMLGATVPFLTWFGAFLSLVGVTMLESSGSPPSVSIVGLVDRFLFHFIFSTIENKESICM